MKEIEIDAMDLQILEQLQREQVADYLMANYDSHGRNFVLDKQGRLIGIDDVLLAVHDRDAIGQSVGQLPEGFQSSGENGIGKRRKGCCWWVRSGHLITP